MRLPFGLDVKTIVITLVFVYFIVPFVLRFWAMRKSTT